MKSEKQNISRIKREFLFLGIISIFLQIIFQFMQKILKVSEKNYKIYIFIAYSITACTIYYLDIPHNGTFKNGRLVVSLLGGFVFWIPVIFFGFCGHMILGISDVIAELFGIEKIFDVPDPASIVQRIVHAIFSIFIASLVVVFASMETGTSSQSDENDIQCNAIYRGVCI